MHMRNVSSLHQLAQLERTQGQGDPYEEALFGS